MIIFRQLSARFLIFLFAIALISIFDLLIPNQTLSQPSSWPTTWTSFGTDPQTGPIDETGCPNHRDVTETFSAVDSEYLFLRMVTVADAGWPSTQPFGEARYKWFFDVDLGGAVISGTSAYEVEYLLLLEDRTDTANADGSRDQLGELTLMESSFDPVTNPSGTFTDVWNQGNSGKYILNTPPLSYNWDRELGTGTPGAGGTQQAMGSNIGYRIVDNNTVDMYVSLTNIESNDVIGTGNFYTDVVDSYTCTVDIYIKTS